MLEKGRRWQLPVVAAAGYVLLALHGRRFAFLCDDAFIALRYARNFVDFGAPVYNLGERVEGFTSPAWVLLVAGFYRLGVPPVRGAHLLGHLGAAAVMGAAVLLWKRLCPRRVVSGSVVVVIALAASAPLAAWSFGGLETPLFAASLLALVTLAVAAAPGDTKSAALAGLAGGGATLVRPEGALAALLVGAILAWAWRRSATRARFFGAYVLAYGFSALPPLIARWRYYGNPLPNTFYVKATGDSAELSRQGLAYLHFAATELGAPFVVLVVIALLWPTPSRDAPTAVSTPGPAVFVACVRVLSLAQLLFVARMGGDFLDLYRFLAALFPLWILTVTLVAFRLYDAHLVRLVSARGRLVPGMLACMALLGTYSWHHWQLGTRALQESEPGRAEHRVEPLGWTRTYALRWAAVGRWIAAHAAPGDTLAVGAAGAIPYYAALPNLDLFGLCDAFVARQGRLLGLRPGHQRFAPDAYILEKHPAFFVLHAEDVVPVALASHPERLPPRDPFWEARGYQWADVRVVAADYGGSVEEGDLRIRMLVRRDRALTLAAAPDVTLSFP